MLPTIQFYKDQVISHCSCLLTVHPEKEFGTKNRIRHSVLWENKPLR